VLCFTSLLVSILKWLINTRDDCFKQHDHKVKKTFTKVSKYYTTGTKTVHFSWCILNAFYQFEDNSIFQIVHELQDRSTFICDCLVYVRTSKSSMTVGNIWTTYFWTCLNLVTSLYQYYSSEINLYCYYLISVIPLFK